jgi:hypothetical protein
MLPFPPQRQEIAWEAARRVFTTDPDLARVVKTWRAWDGTPDTGAPPSSGQMPWVRLTPMPDAMGWSETRTYAAPLLIQVEVVVAGFDARNALRMADALFRAVHPADPARRAATEAIWHEADVLGPTWLRLPFGARDFGDKTGGLLLYGAGTLRLDVFLDTD